MFKRTLNSLIRRLGYTISKYNPRGVDRSAMKAVQELVGEVAAPVVFDVGAHYGELALAFREFLPNAHIYAFEPFPESFEILKSAVADDPNIHVFNFGLGDQNGVQAFHSNSHPATNSLLETDDAGPGNWGDGLLTTNQVVNVQIRTVDAVMKELNLAQIDVMKLDVQGAEHLVMTGADAACRDGKIALLYTEIITRPTYKGQKRFDEALAHYFSLGFELQNFYNASIKEDGMLRQVDAIFTKGG